MGASNFLQWNPQKVNQESDQQYAADSERAGGAGVGALLPSATANKAFYQWSTFIAAFTQAMAAKGYTLSDADIAALAGVLANVVTQVDLTGFAKLASPAFTGNPTAPNPPVGDDSNAVATTHFVRGSALPSATGWVTLPNGITIEWITGPWQPASSTEPTDTQAWPKPFPNFVLFANISMEIQNPTTAMDSWYQLVGYNNNQVVYQRQHGDGGSYQQQTRALILGIGY